MCACVPPGGGGAEEGPWGAGLGWRGSGTRAFQAGALMRPPGSRTRGVGDGRRSGPVGPAGDAEGSGDALEGGGWRAEGLQDLSRVLAAPQGLPCGAWTGRWAGGGRPQGAWCRLGGDACEGAGATEQRGLHTHDFLGAGPLPRSVAGSRQARGLGPSTMPRRLPRPVTTPPEPAFSSVTWGSRSLPTASTRRF